MAMIAHGQLDWRTVLTPNCTMPKDIPLTIRLPEDLHAALVERAKLDRRSLNRQIGFLLQQALFPTVEADAYSQTRRALRSMPKYTLPRPFNRPRGSTQGQG